MSVFAQPIARSADTFYAIVAQLAERRLPKPQVAGSNPVYRSTFPDPLVF